MTLQTAPQPHDQETGGGDDEQEDGEERRYAHPDHDETADERDDGGQPHVRGLLHHLLHRLHVPDHLGLEDAGAHPRVVADRELLHPAAQRVAQRHAHAPYAARQTAHIEQMQREVEQQDHEQHARVEPDVGFRTVPDDGVDDVGGDQGKQPDRAVLPDEREDGDRQSEAVGTEEIAEGPYRMLTPVAVVERRR